MTLRIVVLASGGGSNLQAIIDACAAGDIEATVVGVASDNPSAFAIQRAASHQIDTAVVAPLDNEPRSSFDSRLAHNDCTMAARPSGARGFHAQAVNFFHSALPQQHHQLAPRAAWPTAWNKRH